MMIVLGICCVSLRKKAYNQYKRGLKMIDAIGRELIVHEWNTLFIRQENNSNSIEFTKIVMRMAYTINHAYHLP